MLDTTNVRLLELEQSFKYMGFPCSTENRADHLKHIFGGMGYPYFYVIERPGETLEWISEDWDVYETITPLEVKIGLVSELPTMSAEDLHTLMTEEESENEQYDIWTGRQWFWTDTTYEIDRMDETVIFRSKKGNERRYHKSDQIPYKVRAAGRRRGERHNTALLTDLMDMDGDYDVLVGREWVCFIGAEETLDGRVIFGIDRAYRTSSLTPVSYRECL